jgi:Domain of unknown function (DUF4439)
VSAATDALSTALAAEHAAIFGYGVIGPRLSGAALTQGEQAEAAHRDRRDRLILRLTKVGIEAPAALPAYALPFPVTDAASAQRLAVQLEERAAAIWRVALGPTTGADRTVALDALTDCALRATRWRRATGEQPGTVPLP